MNNSNPLKSSNYIDYSTLDNQTNISVQGNSLFDTSQWQHQAFDQSRYDDVFFKVVVKKILELDFTTDEQVALIKMSLSPETDDAKFAHSIILSHMIKPTNK